jgi:N-acetylmuramoyl-L-alanine amidase
VEVETRPILRLVHRFALGSVLGLLAASAFSADPVVVVHAGGRREIAVRERGDVETIELLALIEGFGIAVTTDPTAGTATLSCQGREVSLFNHKNLVSVGGDLRLLSAPVRWEGGGWHLPLDSVSRWLGPLLNTPVTWRPAQRALLVGPVRMPRLTVEVSAGADQARVVLQATEKVPFQLSQAEGRIQVTIPRELVDVAFQRERLAGGIVEWVEFRGGRDNAFLITLGPRFQSVKALELDDPPRLVIDLQAQPLATSAAPPSATPATDGPTAWSLRTIVIDPGHGGEEVGAQGPGGALEKDVTLSLARKLRSALVNRLGIQAFLTRDGDQFLSLDERAAIANNYKADLFISLHANASRSHGAHGSEVYFLSYQAPDEESRRLAAVEGSAVIPSELSGLGTDLAMVLWDMAQADHLEESSALASRIQEELAGVTGSEGRGVKQAPFRVLVGAAMPAILLEVAFISHPDEEKLLVSDAFQSKVVAAIAEGVGAYARERARRLSAQSATWPSIP